MQLCEHTKRIGDNYGVSCQDCDLTIEGFGYGGWLGSNLTGREQCLHVWWKVSAGEEECPYCHRTRERERQAHYCTLLHYEARNEAHDHGQSG